MGPSRVSSTACHIPAPFPESSAPLARPSHQASEAHNPFKCACRHCAAVIALTTPALHYSVAATAGHANFNALVSTAKPYDSPANTSLLTCSQPWSGITETSLPCSESSVRRQQTMLRLSVVPLHRGPRDKGPSSAFLWVRFARTEVPPPPRGHYTELQTQALLSNIHCLNSKPLHSNHTECSLLKSPAWARICNQHHLCRSTAKICTKHRFTSHLQSTFPLSYTTNTYHTVKVHSTQFTLISC